MGDLRKIVRAFVPGVRAVERKLVESEAEVEEFESDVKHRTKVRRFERRTDEALSEGKALAAEFNLEQMKQALAVAKTGKLLDGTPAPRAIGPPPSPAALIEGSVQPAGGQSVSASVSSQDVEELAMRFARRAHGISDPAQVQSMFRDWSRDLRKSMPEFQAVEVERRARTLINSYS